MSAVIVKCKLIIAMPQMKKKNKKYMNEKSHNKVYQLLEKLSRAELRRAELSREEQN